MISSNEDSDAKPPKYVAAFFRKRPKPTEEAGLQRCNEFVELLSSKSRLRIRSSSSRCEQFPAEMGFQPFSYPLDYPLMYPNNYYNQS